jgi:hypothetical protein
MPELRSYELEGCEDCIMFIANGDEPDDNPQGWSPDQIEANWPSKTYNLCIGGDGETESYFSWRACDCCGSRLGGSRYPVVALFEATEA